jgi:hypothetical protein
MDSPKEKLVTCCEEDAGSTLARLVRGREEKDQGPPCFGENLRTPAFVFGYPITRRAS